MASNNHCNRIEVEKVMFNPDNTGQKVHVFIPSCLPIKTEVCVKCKGVIAEPKEIIRIVKGDFVEGRT